MKVLILTCGTNASYHFCRRFKELYGGNIELIGTDINDSWLVSSIGFLDKFYKVPLSREKEYLEVIGQIISKEKPDYIIPSFDVDQMLFYPESGLLVENGVKSLSTPKNTLCFYKDKKEMNNYLRKKGIPVPLEYRAGDLEQDVNYFVKPVDGVGSSGASIVRGNDILAMDCSNVLIQEICSRPEITVECFHYKGYFTCICRERLETKAGVCTKARVFYDDDIKELCLKFNDSLQLPPYYNLQLMKNVNGDYVITDVNLRSAGGMGISYAAGWDVVGALGSIMMSNNDDFTPYFPQRMDETYVVRAYTEVVTKINRPIIALDLDGTLLDSRRRHTVVLSDILKKRNIDVDLSDLLDYKSLGHSNIDYLISRGIDKELANELQKEWISKIENEEYLIIDSLYPGTIDNLEILSKEADLLLLTARSKKDNVIKQLERLGISHFFKYVEVVGVNDVVKSKTEVLMRYKVKEYYGDTKADYTAAINANVKFHHHNDGFHSEKYVFGE